MDGLNGVDENQAAGAAAQPVTIKRIRVDIPTFDARDIDNWLLRVNTAFDLEGIMDDRQRVVAMANEWLKEKRTKAIVLQRNNEYVSYNDLCNQLATAYRKSRRERHDEFEEMAPRGAQSMTDYLKELEDILALPDDEFKDKNIDVRKALERNTPHDARAAVASEELNSVYATKADAVIKLLAVQAAERRETVMAATNNNNTLKRIRPAGGGVI